jgi:ribonucleotide monophosphatase NagD (HAD superfamily)
MDGTTTANEGNNTKPTTIFQVHTSFASVVDQYDGFILDQFGVLHNGATGLEGAPELVRALARGHSKRLIILSNSSSASASATERLPKLGFDPSDFVGACTSGQAAGEYIRDTYGGAAPTKKALFFTWKTPQTPPPVDFLELCGGNIPLTVDPKEADYVILHGVELLRGPGVDGAAVDSQDVSMGDFVNDGNMEPFEPILRQCAERKIPMVCANLDLIMVKPDGGTGHMPGKIARRYEELGGTSVGFGKPNVAQFEACLRQLGLPRHRVAHVGDSLHHDVAGANATGIASVFVTGGIHRTELGADLGVLPDRDELVALFERYSQTPTHVVPMFRL